MMKMQYMGVLAAALTAAGMLPAETVGVKSPDGKNEIRVTTDGQLVYEVLRNGKVLTGPNAIALEVEGKGTLGVNAKALPGGTVKRTTGEIATPRYKKAKVSLEGNALHLAFEGGWAVDLAARNDGVAYRFATQMGGKIKVVSESAPLTFANGGQTVWAALNNGAGENDPLQCSWEGVYQQYAVKDAPTDAKKNIWYAPITFLYDGAAMSVMESDICSYPGWNFVRDAAKDNVINGLFAKYPKKTVFWEWGKTGYTETPTRYQRVQSREEYLAVTDGTRTFPWRVFLLADDVAKLAEADIVYALASDNRIGDTSWIKPGKVAWDWWNCWNVVGVDFRAGCNTKTYEYFIDFAQKTGVEYIIFDEGWSKHLQIFEYNPEVDVPHLVKYAEERGVGIILWAAWAQFLGREEQVASHYAKLGVKGFKIDFMDRDDQAMVDFLARMAMVAAKYRLVVDYHGMYKPSGFQRTYPNTLNFEGVHGLENCKWGAKTTYMPDKDCTLVFTRMLSGPMDYTPGAMRNGLKSDWKPTPKTPGSPGTRVHQMALMSLFEAPLQMLCDSPSQYLANRECFDFMSKVPTVWDDTVALGGEMDRYAALARRKGDVWYLSAIAGWCGRDASFDTSFLGAGEWTAEIFADGVNADRDATDYRHFTKTVKAGEKLAAKIMPGGGFTARFMRR